MLKLALLMLAALLTGCATARQERAAALQRELPQLVAACNEWAHVDPRLDGPTIHRDGLHACRRLAGGKRLGLADPASVSAYQRYTTARFQQQAGRDSGQRGTYAIPYPLPQSQ